DMLDIYSPNKKTVLTTKFKGAMIDRHRFGQVLVDDAIKAGCKLYGSCICTDPFIKDNFVCGVKIKNADTGIASTIRSKLVVDASGAVPALRKKIKLKESFFENKIEKKDEGFAYREIRKLAKPISDPETARIFMSAGYAKGGYYWYFPEKDDVMNVGIGVPSNLDTSAMKKNLEKIISDDPIFAGSKILYSGAGALPARRSLDSLVANGFMCAGDSASQISPISGGGIAQSMLGGYLCAHVAVEAIKKDDVSQRSLWQLNTFYAKKEGNESLGYEKCMFDGASQAASDLLKIFALHISESGMNFAMKNFMDSSTLSKISLGDTTVVSFSKKVKIIAKSIPRLSLLVRFSRIIYLMNKVKMLYRIYPETPDGFPEWKKRLDSIYKETYKLSASVQG
ncbi:MAG: hypothetical protein U9P44_01395, partial [archaeon]|nr:hypothetical protein [archaeon]